MGFFPRAPPLLPAPCLHRPSLNEVTKVEGLISGRAWEAPIKTPSWLKSCLDNRTNVKPAAGVISMRLKLSSEVQIPATSSVPRRSFPLRENSRQHPRKEVSLQVTLVAGLDEVHGEIVDLSASGAFILLPELPDPTRPFRLIIDLPDEHALILTAEVVRFDIRPADDNLSHLYGVAVRFVNVSDEASLTLLGGLC